jgi:protein-tyrosine phosphatase
MNHYWIGVRNVRLAIMPRPRGGDWLPDDIGYLQRSGVEAIVSALTASEVEELLLSEEENCCRQCGLRFFSFPIEDRSVPAAPKEFREFIDLLAVELGKGVAIAIHCRAGIGRSSLLAACLLVRQGLSAVSALQAIEEARGLSVPDTLEQRLWINQFT